MQIQLINNLGTFSSIRDVVNAYPEGGREGDYCHIGEILYVWNKYSLSWDVWEDKNTYQMIIQEGDHDVEHDQQVGGKQRVIGNATFEHDVSVEGRLIYKNLKGLDCGLFPTEAELKEAYPSPTKGMWGLVGTSSPFALYECTQDGTWTLVNTDSKLIDSFDLAAYDSVKEIVEEIANNGYIFYGFAREDTNPIKPSNFGVFYITELNEGTFVNFDGIVVKSRSALLWNYKTQSWSAHTLYPKCFVDTDMIVDGAVTTEKMADASVSESKIVDGAVTEGKLSPDVLSMIEKAGNEIKYVSIENLDDLKTPQTDTGAYYVYQSKTDKYTQIVGILLVQTDWANHQITQHFFSNYKMDAEGAHVDNEATYYKRHYGVSSSVIETGVWTAWENAIMANAELKAKLDELATNIGKETKERTSQDDYLNTRITAEIQGVNEEIEGLSTSLQEGNIRFVELSNLDTVLGSTYVEVGNALMTKNGNHTLKYIVTDGGYFVGYIDMFADSMMHCLTQEFTTNYLIDADGKLDGSHDHKLHKYVRYYNIRWSDAHDWRGKEWAIGTWTKWNSPLEDVEDKVTTIDSVISAIKTGDLPLVTPSIVPATNNTYLWQVYNAEGSLITTSADKTLNVAFGYKVNFQGAMSWSAKDGYKNPTAMNGGDWSAKALPTSGVLSDAISYTSITSDKTISANVKASKQGLVYKNGIIKWADSTDYDSTSASVKVHFQYKVVATTSSEALNAASLQVLLGSKFSLQDSKSKTITGVTTDSTQYFVYAYPSKLGKLSKIIMNDATPLLDGGFELSTISVVDPQTMASVEYYVYTSVQKGAFTNVKLDIA